jgi:hypothetical protein
MKLLDFSSMSGWLAVANDSKSIPTGTTLHGCIECALIHLFSGFGNRTQIALWFMDILGNDWYRVGLPFNVFTGV